MYLKQTAKRPIIIAVHVDDMTILALSNDIMSQVKKELKSKLNVTDMEEINHILGMEIERNWEKGTITLFQKAYLKKSP